MDFNSSSRALPWVTLILELAAIAVSIEWTLPCGLDLVPLEVGN